MHKRILSLLLALCLLLSAAPALADVSATIQDTAEVSTGPGYGYWEPGLYLNSGCRVRAISRTWDDYYGVWQVLVEFTWGNDLCRGYVVSRRMDTQMSSIPIEQPLQGCYLLSDADAFAGPGITYTLWNDTVWRGTSATLIAVENGWGFIECWNGAKQANWRVWVRMSDLSCGGSYSGGGSQPSYYSYLPEIPYGGIRAGCGNERSIMWVQQCLRSCGYGQLSVDGKWGLQTTNAVRQFRIDHGYGAGDVVTYEIACDMLDMFYNRGMPLSYLRHYLPQ